VKWLRFRFPFAFAIAEKGAQMKTLDNVVCRRNNSGQHHINHSIEPYASDSRKRENKFSFLFPAFPFFLAFFLISSNDAILQRFIFLLPVLAISNYSSLSSDHFSILYGRRCLSVVFVFGYAIGLQVSPNLPEHFFSFPSRNKFSFRCKINFKGNIKIMKENSEALQSFSLSINNL